MNIAPFITPLTPYDTTGAAKAMAANTDVKLSHEDRQASLAENKRQFNEELPMKQFRTFGDQYNENRRAEYVQNESDTKLLQWIKQLTEDDPEKAQAAAPFIHGLLQLHGIDMNFDGKDDTTGEAVSPATPPEAPASATPATEAAPKEKAPPAAKPYETKVSPGTKAATRPIPGAPSDPEAFGEWYRQTHSKEPPTDPEKFGEWYRQQHRGNELPPGMPLSAYMQQNYGSDTEPLGAQLPPGTAFDSAQSGAMPMELLSGRSDGGVAPPAEVQAEMARQGQPYTGQTAPEPPPAKPKGQWTFTKNGKELMSIDTGKLQQLNEKRTGALSQGAEASVLPAEDKAYVAAMMDGARKAGMNPDELQAFQKNWVQPELDRRQKERAAMATARAMAIKANAGPGISGISKVNDDIMAIQKEFAGKYQMPKLEERRRAAESAIGLAESDNPVAQRDAFTAHLKAMFSGVTSDKELGFAKDAAGKLTRIQMAFNDWFSGGELPPNYLELLGEANQIIQEQTRLELQKIGALAGGYIMRTPALSLDANGRRQAAGVVQGFFTGDYGKTPELSGPMGVSGMGKGAGGGGVSVSTSERTRGGNLSDKTPEAQRLLSPKKK